MSDPGVTDWARYDTPAMWAMLAGHRCEPQWRQVAGWRRIVELTEAHLAALRAVRADLVAAWPPARSTAAAGYAAHLDYLIDHMRGTRDVAAANLSVTAATTTALGVAQRELGELHARYPARPGPAAAPGADPDAVLRAALDARARELMGRLSNELVAARFALRRPSPYRQNAPLALPLPADHRPVRPPTIPPVIPVATVHPGGDGGPELSGVVGGGGPVDGGSPGGVVPGGGGGVPGGSAPPGGWPGPSVPPGSRPPGWPPGGGPGWPPGSGPWPGGGERPPGSGPGRPPAWPGRPGGGGSGAGPRAVPGVIGTVTGADPPQATPARQVNPVGGVIGAPPPGRPAGAGPHGTPLGGAGGAAGWPPGTVPGLPPTGAIPGGAGAVAGGESARRPLYPRQGPQWRVPPHRSGVIEDPGEPPPIDPGPAIGLNR
ncbi:hypothetical protein GCM10010123_23660 [Pilimelia anulata]|uniref:Uncharacterized protein n=1 Tax=Pilimelia anulata TaxID=53371 RepID=A0A8J3B786_9ACTN|nr:hypothetical protein [Pilimelia anulata]GGJ93059.1 hypothetical protein GCM10010123_23660 [Pilimelia anulata]